jgi:hypothetical protein
MARKLSREQELFLRELALAQARERLQKAQKGRK